MKKKSIVNLIKYYAEENDIGFRNEAYEIAKSFDYSGDHQLAEYIIALMSNSNVFVPQLSEDNLTFFERVSLGNDPLPLPSIIRKDVLGVINAINRNMGINKFLFQGPPGTGKTETVKQMARILSRELFMVDFPSIIDSKLGQTQRNIVSLFSEINGLNNPEKVIILFDELDAIALDRTSSNDLREMGRVTSTVLKNLDKLSDYAVLVATTNLFEHLDKAIIRRFDAVVDFDRYSREDLLEISEIILSAYQSKYKSIDRNIRLFQKIMSSASRLPYPGEMKNIIKTSIAMSDDSDRSDYLRRLYIAFHDESEIDLLRLKAKGFTVREIEVLTKVSKSQVARELRMPSE